MWVIEKPPRRCAVNVEDTDRLPIGESIHIPLILDPVTVSAVDNATRHADALAN
jgi:hypothetical protein